MLRSIVLVLGLFQISCGNSSFQVPSDRELTVKKNSLKGDISAVKLYLDDEYYFDAATLGRQIANHVELQDDQGISLSQEDYKITVSPEISNENFQRDFQVFAVGEEGGYYQTKTQEKGKFKVKDMYNGSYDIRAQKNYDLIVESKQPEPQPGEQPVPAKKMTFCFTLYSDYSGVEMEQGQEQKIVFSSFNLMLLDQNCEKSTNSKKITLK
ncbi:MAG: hypothetical protein AB7T49_08285 [Oligoflexales bacterium]